MKSEIRSSGVSVSGGISNDMIQIFNENESKANPFIKLFWELQKIFYFQPNTSLL